MENIPQLPDATIARNPNRFATGLAATAAAAGILLAPTTAHAAEESTDGRTSHAIPQEDHGYQFEPGFAVPDIDNPAFTATVVHTTLPLERQGMDYAPEFSRSAEALQVGPADVDLVLNQLEGLAGRFLGDVKIEVQGSASAEDGRNSADAGLGEPSRDNVDLANNRAKSFVSELEDVLDDSGDRRLENAEVITKPGVEQVLTDDEITDLRSFAHRQGYSDINSMVTAFNDGHASDVTTERLNELLASQRGVRVTISGNMPVLLPAKVYEVPKDKTAKNPQDAKDREIQKPNLFEDVEKATSGLASKGFIVGSSLAALAVGVRRRRESDLPRVVPLTLPAGPRKKPDDYDVVSEN
ncbi:MAG TPA: hypothetical protein VLA92_00390 [Candidatus Saccharimonadales bacterium]|nr:hypothetical protein [Candidatus Saccharimonadales bacterium]